MPDQDEQTLHKESDHYGELSVIEKHGERILRFDSEVSQGQMRLSEPNGLTLRYSQVMVSCLCFNPFPQSVLILGMGSASLCKFIHSQLPSSQIDVVELRDSVVRMAQRYFELPSHDNINVFISDAHAYLKQCPKHYDMIFVDIFDGQGIAEQAAQLDFIRSAAKLLSPQGILAYNLWAGKRKACIEQGIRNFFSVFRLNVLSLSVPRRANHIFWGFKQPSSIYSKAELERNSQIWELHAEIPMRKIFADICSYNREHLKFKE